MARKKLAPIKPWTCPKCGATVYVSPELHEVLCYLYRRERDNGQ